MICRICVKYAHLVHLLHFYLPQGANFQKFYSKGSILPGSACTCREKRSGKEGKHPSTSTSSLAAEDLELDPRTKSEVRVGLPALST